MNNYYVNYRDILEDYILSDNLQIYQHDLIFILSKF